MASVVKPSGDDDGSGASHLRHLKVAIEFKYLMKHAPTGVFLIPEFDSMRRFHGVIFVRRGYYRDGTFRFTLTLPDNYSSLGSHPQFTFVPPVFNPMVDAETGVLDISLDPSMKEWQPEKHFILNALTYLKSIFYLQSFDDFDQVANTAALAMFRTDMDAFRKAAAACSRESLGRIHDPAPPNCPIVFTEPKPAHDIIKRNVLTSFQESPQGAKEAADAADLEKRRAGGEEGEGEEGQRGDDDSEDEDFMESLSVGRVPP
jgi:ubiquitin-protein ligase